MKEQSPVPSQEVKDNTAKSGDDKDKDKEKEKPKTSIPPVKGLEKGFDRAYRKGDEETPWIVPCWILISLSHNPSPEGDMASGTATTSMKVRTAVRTLHYTTLHYTTLHYTTLHYTTLH
jgi:hypothetical protein